MSRVHILPHSWLSMWSLHTVVNNACHHKTNDNRWFPALTNTGCRFDIREDKFQTHRFGRDKNRQLGKVSEDGTREKRFNGKKDAIAKKQDNSLQNNDLDW